MRIQNRIRFMKSCAKFPSKELAVCRFAIDEGKLKIERSQAFHFSFSISLHKRKKWKEKKKKLKNSKNNLNFLLLYTMPLTRDFIIKRQKEVRDLKNSVKIFRETALNDFFPRKMTKMWRWYFSFITRCLRLYLINLLFILNSIFCHFPQKACCHQKH